MLGQAVGDCGFLLVLSCLGKVGGEGAMCVTVYVSRYVKRLYRLWCMRACVSTHTGILGNDSVHGHASVCTYNLCL